MRPAISNRVKRLAIQERRASGGTTSAPKTNNSSKIKGMARAKANGQPMIPPAANSEVAARVRCLFFVLVGVNA